VHEATIKRGSYPSPLNYHGFPKSCCTSVNEIICHGIPDSTVLIEGDIVNIDVTVFHDGVHGDCSETVFVGAVDDRIRDLVITTFDCWMAAITFCRPGRSYSDIGGIIEDIIAPKGYSTVKEFCGHGVGRGTSRWFCISSSIYYPPSYIIVGSVPPVPERLALPQYSAQWYYGGGPHLHYRAHDMHEEQ